MTTARSGTRAHVAREPRADDWLVRGVSIQGYNHLSRGVECQDAYRSAFVPSAAAWVVAISDGAGSRSRSAEGSALAAGLATSVFGTLLRTAGVPADAGAWKNMMSDGYLSVLTRFGRAVVQLGDDLGEFAATLSVAIIAPPWVGVVSVGDGCLIIQAGAGRLHLIPLGERESEYSNETDFLTSPDPLNRAVVRCIYEPELRALVLATDGLVPLATVLDQDGWERPNGTFIEPLLASVTAPDFDPTDIVKFLLHERIGATSGDDKTMVLAVAR
jgi:Protein phosphatase 2C